MADILSKRPMDAEMTIFKTEIEPYKLNDCIDNILMRVDRLETKFADTQPVDRWISVKDRLPDESCECLGVIDGEVTEVSYSPKQKGLICVWSMCDADGFKPLPDDAVTHWMPLPEPPKDGDTNG